MVILPDHIHSVWTLPAGDVDFFRCRQKIKGRFTPVTGLRGALSPGMLKGREAGLCQCRSGNT